MLVPETNRRDGLKGLIPAPPPGQSRPSLGRLTERCFQDWEVLSALLGQGFVGLSQGVHPALRDVWGGGRQQGQVQGYSAGGP